MKMNRNTLCVLLALIALPGGSGGSRHPTIVGYHPPTSMSKSRKNLVEICNGEEKLKSDIGILSFGLGGISSLAGFYSLQRFSIPSNDVSIWSTLYSLALWVPGGLLSALAFSGPWAYISGNLINLGSLAVTIYGAVSIIHGTFDIIISGIDEFLAIISLMLSSLTTFPEVYDDTKQLFQEIFGKDEVDMWIHNYGCNTSDQAENTLQSVRDAIFYDKF